MINPDYFGFENIPARNNWILLYLADKSIHTWIPIEKKVNPMIKFYYKQPPRFVRNTDADIEIVAPKLIKQDIREVSSNGDWLTADSYLIRIHTPSSNFQIVMRHATVGNFWLDRC